MSLLKFSETETKRFNLNVYRASAEKIDEKQLFREAVDLQADLVIYRVPVEECSQLHRLERLKVPFIIADTLVYYRSGLEAMETKPYRNEGLSFWKIEPSEKNLLGEMIEKVFGGYANHYKSNPYLPSAGLIEGYKEWAESFIGKSSSKIGWFASLGGTPIGFCLCSSDESDAEGVLYGVLPEASGGGVYSDMIRFTQNYFKAQQKSFFKVSTQVQNFAVQKVWTREGFFMDSAYITVHINTFFLRSDVKPIEYQLNFSTDHVDQFSLLCGDTNPVHLDATEARNLGFDGRIVHGALISAELSKVYGTQFPGPGSLFMNYTHSFLNPIYLGCEYLLRVTFPYYNANSKILLSCGRIFDSKGRMIMVSYNYLKLTGQSIMRYESEAQLC